jgi:hypothetical protein
VDLCTEEEEVSGKKERKKRKTLGGSRYLGFRGDAREKDPGTWGLRDARA